MPGQRLFVFGRICIYFPCIQGFRELDFFGNGRIQTLFCDSEVASSTCQLLKCIDLIIIGGLIVMPLLFALVETSILAV